MVRARWPRCGRQTRSLCALPQDQGRPLEQDLHAEAAGISLFLLIVFFAPEIWPKRNGATEWVIKAAPGFLLGLLSFAGSVVLGASPLATGKGGETEKILAILPVRLVLAIATPLFIGILIAALSIVTDKLLVHWHF